MLSARIGHRVILFIGLVLAANSARAEMLLVEFGWTQPDPVTLPANYVVLVSGGSGWHDAGPISQYPTTMQATPAIVNLWNERCARGSSCSVDFSNGGQQPFDPPGGSSNIDYILGGNNRLWADGWIDGAPVAGNGQWIAATHVPQKGNGNQALWGYEVTRIERIVTADSQFVRIYGINVPEPATWLLILFACAIHLSGRYLR